MLVCVVAKSHLHAPTLLLPALHRVRLALPIEVRTCESILHDAARASVRGKQVNTDVKPSNLAGRAQRDADGLSWASAACLATKPLNSVESARCLIARLRRLISSMKIDPASYNKSAKRGRTLQASLSCAERLSTAEQNQCSLLSGPIQARPLCEVDHTSSAAADVGERERPAMKSTPAYQPHTFHRRIKVVATALHTSMPMRRCDLIARAATSDCIRVSR